MTYHTPDGWRPPHGPQHAAPFGSSTPLRVHAHRALRLFVAAGAWGAGLCLVVGLVAMVAGADRATPISAQAGDYRAPQDRDPAQGPPRSVRPTGGRLEAVRTFDGTGDLTTPPFRVAADGRWELEWSYSCPARTPGGHLIIREGDAAGGGISVAASGTAGHGSTWTYSDGASHYLVVITNCGWTVKVAAYG